MTVTGTERTSPRQAIALLATTHPTHVVDVLDPSLAIEAAAELLRCRLLDMVASLTRVDGATMTVMVQDADSARDIAPLVPAGVDVMIVDETVAPTSVAAHAVRRHLDLAFARIVVVVGDALPLPPRTVSTGLSVLAGADLVLGATPAGRLYLVGARDEQGAAILEAAGIGSIEAVECLARRLNLISRRLEPRRALLEHQSLPALRGSVAQLGDTAPRLAGWFDRHQGSAAAPS